MRGRRRLHRHARVGERGGRRGHRDGDRRARRPSSAPRRPATAAVGGQRQQRGRRLRAEADAAGERQRGGEDEQEALVIMLTCPCSRGASASRSASWRPAGRPSRRPTTAPAAVTRRSRTSWFDLGNGLLARRSCSPGRASPIARVERLRALLRRRRSRLLRFGIAGWTSSASTPLVVAASSPICCAASPACWIAMRVCASVAAISGPRSASASVRRLVLSRMPAIDAWLRSVSSAGQPLGQRRQPLEQLRRGIEDRAEAAGLGRDHRHAVGAVPFGFSFGADDRRRALARAVERDRAGAGEAARAPSRSCPAGPACRR